VYECDQDAYKAIMAGEIVAGDILVIRYEGCKGAPGMKELMLSIDALIGLGLDKKGRAYHRRTFLRIQLRSNRRTCFSGSL